MTHDEIIAELEEWKLGSATVNGRLLAEIERLQYIEREFHHVDDVAAILALREQVAALESREVCTVAHAGDVTTCGYCQRDALRAAITAWADYQEPDSVLDQLTDIRLRREADAAAHALIRFARETKP